MKKALFFTRTLGLILIVFSNSLQAQSTPAGSVIVDKILRSIDRVDGLCVIVNESNPEQAIHLAKRSKFSIHMIHQDPETVTALRKAIDQQGLYGRILVSKFNGTEILAWVPKLAQQLC